jgi:hypothetical protein
LGFGFFIKLSEYDDATWELDLKRPDSLQNVFLHFPLHFYL